MHLSPDDLANLQRLIQGHYLALAIELYGADALPAAALEQAQREGLLTPAQVAAAGARGVAGDAYVLGYHTHATPALVREPPAEFLARVDGLYDELSDWEKRMARAARQRGAQLVVGLGNTVATDFTTTAISSDNDLAQRYRRIIAEETASAIEARETWKRLRGTLGEKLGEDWTRNLHRIAATEIQGAVNAGIADAIEEQEGHKAQVAVIPNDGACPVCRKMYLTGGKPRIFTLGDLAPYGANFKKPQAQWVATVPPLHPWCACALVYVAEGWTFDETWTLQPPHGAISPASAVA